MSCAGSEKWSEEGGCLKVPTRTVPAPTGVKVAQPVDAHVERLKNHDVWQIVIHSLLTHTHTHTHARIHTRTHAYTHARALSLSHTHTHTVTLSLFRLFPHPMVFWFGVRGTGVHARCHSRHPPQHLTSRGAQSRQQDGGTGAHTLRD
jgi:hypothetical protein